MIPPHDAPCTESQPGETLDGRFLLSEEIGHGGMSTIFKALDLQNPGETVVVKVRLPAFSSGVGTWSMFEREEAIGRQLDHPFILKFLPLAQDKRRSYVVTEYVPGRTLADRLGEQRPLLESRGIVHCQPDMHSA